MGRGGGLKMTDKYKTEEAMKTVSRTRLKQTTGKQETLQVKLFATDTAQVEVALGKTINLGNYESARVEVRISVPCYVEEALVVYKETLDTVKRCIGEEIEAMEQATKDIPAELR
jgi:hypothetical protein